MFFSRIRNDSGSDWSVMESGVVNLSKIHIGWRRLRKRMFPGEHDHPDSRQNFLLNGPKGREAKDGGMNTTLQGALHIIATPLDASLCFLGNQSVLDLLSYWESSQSFLKFPETHVNYAGEHSIKELKEVVMDRHHAWEHSDRKSFRAVLDKPIIDRKKPQRASRSTLTVERVSGKRVARTEPAYRELDDEDRPPLSKTKKRRQNNRKEQKKISGKVTAASNEGVAKGPEISDACSSSRKESALVKAAHNDKAGQKPLLTYEPQMAPGQRSHSQENKSEAQCESQMAPRQRSHTQKKGHGTACAHF